MSERQRRYTPIELPQFPKAYLYNYAEECLDNAIKHISVVVDSHVEEGSGLNHWRIFLTFNETSSICINMVTISGTDTTGYCGILRKDYDITRAKFVAIPVVLRNNPVTLRDVMSALHNAGRFRYKYYSQTAGCRHWVSKAIETLQAAGLVIPPSAEFVAEEINYVWTSEKERSPNKAQKGTFY
ncbi:hypothetical protein DAEQUDRAFT_552236 [Daedalea quercina L-15889]|uniref:DUF7770 domain-containing protein n=1 Tax=Daedalea quercina L-15889 TaxID=1314783 RepID=A0A165T3T7_9APHY|nr:hypothetical protein DAEQUDRAFT_552236 [Daedalea quercina L-15889]